jgi:Phage integrase family
VRRSLAHRCAAHHLQGELGRLVQRKPRPVFCIDGFPYRPDRHDVGQGLGGNQPEIEPRGAIIVELDEPTGRAAIVIEAENLATAAHGRIVRRALCRSVDRSARLCGTLKPCSHKNRQEFERKRAGSRWQQSGLVFTTTVGTGLEARNLTREFKRHLAAAGLPAQFRFYDLRHAAASLLVADGLPITVVSAMLGHALTSTTLNNYAHVLPGADRFAADAMERLLG